MRSLRWKFTLSYILITVMTLLFLEGLAFALLSWQVSAHFPQLLVAGLKPYAPKLAPYFSSTAPDHAAIDAWLQSIGDLELSESDIKLTISAAAYQRGFLMVLDREGHVVAGIGDQAAPEGTTLETRLAANARALLPAVLSGRRDSVLLSDVSNQDMLIAAAPIMGAGSRVLGALVIETPVPQLHTAFLLLFPPSLLLFTALAGLIGAIFGFFTANRLTWRIRHLARAASHWSSGGFDVAIADRSGDELGQLARDLDQMAQQLQLLLQERQQFVTLQERNRLARDLHDSVKQQVFALGMRLSAARSYLDYDLAAATQQLVEADRLIAQTQQELTSIIHELRPAALQDRGLARALQEYIVEWSQQHAITASVQIAEAVVIPAMLEVALVRVVQEALSNVARHSRATAVQVQLVCQSDAVVLSILDNGQGFAPAAIKGHSVGLHSMHERVAELGGQVDVYSTIGKGTCVVARCMLRLNQSTRGEHSLR